MLGFEGLEKIMMPRATFDLLRYVQREVKLGEQAAYCECDGHSVKYLGKGAN